MKKLLFAFLILGQGAQAQVLECPPSYPGQDNSTAKLVSAGVIIGEPNGGGDLHGDIRKVRNGRIVEYGIPEGPKSFVCTYGDRYELRWSKQLDEKVSRCKLVVQEKRSARAVAATLTCK